MSNNQTHAEVLVLGGGPGGYTAAFRAADLGKQVVLVERYPVLGGVCLNVGCIPSKALLHTAQIIHEADEMAEHGVSFGKPTIDLDKIRGWKESVSQGLNQGLGKLAKQRKESLDIFLRSKFKSFSVSVSVLASFDVNSLSISLIFSDFDTKINSVSKLIIKKGRFWSVSLNVSEIFR
jgi:protoporphyrinogen oxidase